MRIRVLHESDAQLYQELRLNSGSKTLILMPSPTPPMNVIGNSNTCSI